MDSFQSRLDDKITHFSKEQTNAFRLINGTSTNALYKNLYIDVFDQVLLVSTRERGIPQSLTHELHACGLPVFRKKLEQTDKAPPTPLFGDCPSTPFIILENGVQFIIKMSAGYSQGIFLDQRDNRLRVRQRTTNGSSILNCFAYTGAFSVAAAMGGATTTTLDLAQPCLDWARENFIANGIDHTKHFFCKGDAFHWLDRFTKQGRQFDGIILDPPTFSRDKNGKTFSVIKDYTHLFEFASKCLAPGGWILCTTNCRKLSLQQFLSTIEQAKPCHPIQKISSLEMPGDFTGDFYLKSLWVDC